MVKLRTYSCKCTVNEMKSGKSSLVEALKKAEAHNKYSPAWVVQHASEAPEHKLALISRVREGVEKEEWKHLIKYIGATEKEFEEVLPTSISSMQKKSKYDPETSERIYELAGLFGLGFEVFDSEEAFKNWLVSPSKPLGGAAPFDLLDSSFGFELVSNEINRIKYNVYS